MKVDDLPLSEQLKLLRGVSGIRSIQGPDGIDPAPQADNKVSFAELLGQHFAEVNRHGAQAERSMERSVLGQELHPHTTVIAVQKAMTSLTLMMSIKERLERAYQELIRTPLG